MPGDQVMAGRGGRGGKGNTRFKSATNRAPRQCTPGGEGEVRLLVLELKVIADVGLIGKPNAGKSTLAEPAVACPARNCRLSVYDQVSQPGHRADQSRSFVRHGRHSRADRRGARRGRVGARFLRHVQRAGILIHMVEPRRSTAATRSRITKSSATNWTNTIPRCATAWKSSS